MSENKRISELNPLPQAASADLFAVVDTSIAETKNITVADLMAKPLPIGIGIPNTGEFSVLTVGGNPVNEFSTDVTLGGDSDTAIPTEKAVKTYVDTAISGIAFLNIRHITSDSTAAVWDSVLADTASGPITVELQPTGEGKIDIKKSSTDSNLVTLITSSGLIDGQATNIDLNIGYGNISLLCDGTDFYII